MKELRIIKLDDFLEVADSFDTPLKIVEVEIDGVEWRIIATVYLRNFMVTWERTCNREEKQKYLGTLRKHDFKEGMIIDSPYRKIIW